MGAISVEMKVTTSIPLVKLFKAFVLDADHLIPKIMPSVIKSLEILKGNGGPGTIKLLEKVVHTSLRIDEERKKGFQLHEGNKELHIKEVNNRGFCAIAQAESLKYKLLDGLAIGQ